MSERRTQTVGHGDEACPNLARRGDHRQYPVAVRRNIARLGLRREPNARMVSKRRGELRIEGEPPDSQPCLLAVVRWKGHCSLGLVDTPELDAAECRRPAGYESLLEAQLAQGRPAAGHQPFAARLVARKGLLIENDHAKPTSRGKERRRGPGRPGADDGDIGVDGILYFRVRASLSR